MVRRPKKHKYRINTFQICTTISRARAEKWTGISHSQEQLPNSVEQQATTSTSLSSWMALMVVEWTTMRFRQVGTWTKLYRVRLVQVEPARVESVKTSPGIYRRRFRSLLIVIMDQETLPESCITQMALISTITLQIPTLWRTHWARRRWRDFWIRVSRMCIMAWMRTRVLLFRPWERCTLSRPIQTTTPIENQIQNNNLETKWDRWLFPQIYRRSLLILEEQKGPPPLTKIKTMLPLSLSIKDRFRGKLSIVGRLVLEII